MAQRAEEAAEIKATFLMEQFRAILALRLKNVFVRIQTPKNSMVSLPSEFKAFFGMVLMKRI